MKALLKGRNQANSYSNMFIGERFVHLGFE
jgi:hypothetical protein